VNTGVILGERSDMPMSGPDLMEIAKSSVVTIRTSLAGKPAGHGTTFAYKQVVDGDRSTIFFLTNLHNFSGSLRMYNLVLRLASAGATEEAMTIRTFIEFHGQEYEVDKIVAFRGALFAGSYPSQHDFAIFSVNCETSEGIRMFALPSAEEVRPGESVFAFGFPRETDLGITEGMVSAVYRDHKVPNFQHQIQHSILINPGNSGGPTVNAYGVAVGMSTWKLVTDGDTGINFSVNVSHTFELCRQADQIEEISMKAIYKRFVARAREHFKYGS
jgi:hypothetical protein